jgi:ATP-dependent Lon protease
MAEVDSDDLISIIEDSSSLEEIPHILPLMPLRDVVIFTDMLLPLFVARDRSVAALEAAIDKDGFILLVAQKEAATEDPKAGDIFRMGTVARVLRVLKMPDGRVKTLVQGLCRAKIERLVRKKGFYRARVELIKEPKAPKTSMEVEAMMRNAREASEKILALRGELSDEISAILEGVDDPGKLADLVSSNLRLKIAEAQALLKIVDPIQRLRRVNDILMREVELSSVQARIQSNVKDEISKSQRDYFLREQMRAINRELGEEDERSRELADFEKKIKQAKMPPQAAKEARQQLRRLEQMHPEAAESGVVRTYLEWLVEMPWSKASRDDIDIKRAKAVLDKEHYGLEKVKDRILEYLSVRKLNPNSKGTTLCFVGPPGVGKTSLGRAIAAAMGREFVRVSLGGIRDEAEIRGHRRTYIGAMPGRILQGLRQAGSNNPVFMMDEIDKLGADFRGDPSSALLEALDPEQNSNFSDHYLNLPFDVSQVLFVLTANITDTIPSALLDRMEVIHLSGYTELEKHQIATQFLLPRQMAESGLKPDDLKLGDRALDQIITEYTAEAGLRNLERELGSICRKTARKIAEGQEGPFTVDGRNLKRYLGVPKFIPELEAMHNQIGVATGLAWTSAGGEVLYIEATIIDGKGDLIVTGQLGEVMQESARAALSYTRANLARLGIKSRPLDNSDIHIHVPAGSTPKDGPSAGIAMAVALMSVLAQKPVEHRIAMTGEITLQGRVLPIGGLKEKALGALRARARSVIIPAKNRPDLAEIPRHVRQKIKFVPVETIDEVLPLVIPGLKLKR